MMESSDSLGPWTGDDLGETIRSASTLDADSDLPADVRFRAGVAKLIRRRLAVAEEDHSWPAIFLLNADVSDLRTVVELARVPMLDNGGTQLTGRIWFVSPAVVMGHYTTGEMDSDEALFSYVVQTLGCGDIPAVVMDPRYGQVQVRAYRRGLSSPEDYETVSVNDSDLSLADVYEVITTTHETSLITPINRDVLSVWESSAKFWVSKSAERTIQVLLSVAIQAAFLTCRVRTEQSQMTGRIDLEIERKDARDPSIVTRLILLELKVLRSYGSTGDAVSHQETEDWIKSGVTQAATYRDERQVRVASLCCFDMRKLDEGDTCFECVREDAVILKVDLRRWFLFNTQEAYRDSQVCTTLEGPS